MKYVINFLINLLYNYICLAYKAFAEFNEFTFKPMDLRDGTEKNSIRNSFFIGVLLIGYSISLYVLIASFLFLYPYFKHLGPIGYLFSLGLAYFLSRRVCSLCSSIMHFFFERAVERDSVHRFIHSIRCGILRIKLVRFNFLFYRDRKSFVLFLRVFCLFSVLFASFFMMILEDYYNDVYIEVTNVLSCTLNDICNNLDFQGILPREYSRNILNFIIKCHECLCLFFVIIKAYALFFINLPSYIITAVKEVLDIFSDFTSEHRRRCAFLNVDEHLGSFLTLLKIYKVRDAFHYLDLRYGLHDMVKSMRPEAGINSKCLQELIIKYTGKDFSWILVDPFIGEYQNPFSQTSLTMKIFYDLEKLSYNIRTKSFALFLLQTFCFYSYFRACRILAKSRRCI